MIICDNYHEQILKYILMGSIELIAMADILWLILSHVASTATWLKMHYPKMILKY